MSGFNNLICGIGAATGPAIATSKPFRTDKTVWYVSSVSGVDSATGGTERKSPLLTTLQAVTNAVDGDVIVYLSDHDEIIVDQIAISKRLTFIGEGKVDGFPMASLTPDDNVDPDMLNVSATCRFSNIRFKTNISLVNVNKVAMGIRSPDVRIEECLFDSENEFNGGSIKTWATVGGLLINNCTFRSTAISEATRPPPAITSTAEIDDLKIYNTVFDGGLFGFKDASNRPYAAYFGFASDYVELENVSLLRGADIYLEPTSSKTHFNITACSGGARDVW